MMVNTIHERCRRARVRTKARTALMTKGSGRTAKMMAEREVD